MVEDLVEVGVFRVALDTGVFFVITDVSSILIGRCFSRGRYLFDSWWGVLSGRWSSCSAGP